MSRTLRLIRSFDMKIRLRRLTTTTLILLLVLTASVLRLNYSNITRISPPSRCSLKYLMGPSWLRVSDSVYVYSAFLDRRGRTRQGDSDQFLLPVRIVGLWRVPPRAELKKDPLNWYRLKDETPVSPAAYHCKLFYENRHDRDFESTQGSLLTRQIFEEGLKVYAGTFFNCYVNESVLERVGDMNSLSVAIYPSNVLDYPTKLVPVHVRVDSAHNNNTEKWRDPSLPAEGQLSLCIRPLFGPMTNLVALAQFLAYYEAQGASVFHFYDMGLSTLARTYLASLSSVTLSPWNLPTGNWTELWDYGSLAALTDCLYRNMGLGGRVLVVDLDEFMAPQGNGSHTLKSLIFSNRLRAYSQLQVRNTFFCKEFCPSPGPEGMPIFSCLERTKRVWHVKIRSKYFVNPDQVVQVGHHWVTKFQGDPRQASSYEFSSTELVLNHYRECGSISSRAQPILGRLTVVDSTMLKYRDKMLRTGAYQSSKHIMERISNAKGDN